MATAGLGARFPDARTHGRWPWLAAAAAPALTGLAASRRRELAADGSWVEWLPLAALLWHQTEEWVWPGGFLPWMNREAIGSEADEYPLTRRLGLLVNVGLGWGVGVAAGVSRDPAISSLQLSLLAGNVGLHVGEAVRSRRRNPGLLTATFLFAPLVARGYPALARRTDPAPIRRGAIAGALASVGLMAAMRLRIRLHR